jgi:MoaA/NifB/PqqE/SkfB family radical SAM enzyme
VARIKEVGFRSNIASNGALLGGKKGDALLEAGVDELTLNVCETGEAYEKIYKLPWEKTLHAVTEFAGKAGDSVKIKIVLVNHRDDSQHLNVMRQFWRDHGIDQFQIFGEIGNRGGALELDHMDFESYPELETAFDLLDEQGPHQLCQVPFFDNFVGYDGNFYLCCQDWRKQVPVGNVFDSSWEDVIRARIEGAASREPVCRHCAVDPANRIVLQMRSDKATAREPAQMAANQAIMSAAARENSEKIAPGSTANIPEPSRPTRDRGLIPVRAL